MKWRMCKGSKYEIITLTNNEYTILMVESEDKRITTSILETSRVDSQIISYEAHDFSRWEE